MKLNIKTEYTLQIVLYLAENREIINAKELSEALRIPRAFVPKVLKGMIDLGLADSIEGVKGGYYLSKEPSEISMLDILLSSEPTMRGLRCLEERGFLGGNSKRNALLKYYQQLKEEMTQKLLDKKIDEFL